jgi:hypothetical protein
MSSGLPVKALGPSSLWVAPMSLGPGGHSNSNQGADKLTLEQDFNVKVPGRYSSNEWTGP